MSKPATVYVVESRFVWNEDENERTLLGVFYDRSKAQERADKAAETNAYGDASEDYDVTVTVFDPATGERGEVVYSSQEEDEDE